MDWKTLIDSNFSKKEGISLGTILALVQIGAPPWTIVVIAAIAIIMQGSFDITKLIKSKEKKNEDSSTDVPAGD